MTPNTTTPAATKPQSRFTQAHLNRISMSVMLNPCRKIEKEKDGRIPDLSRSEDRAFPFGRSAAKEYVELSG